MRAAQRRREDLPFQPSGGDESRLARPRERRSVDSRSAQADPAGHTVRRQQEGAPSLVAANVQPVGTCLSSGRQAASDDRSFRYSPGRCLAMATKKVLVVGGAGGGGSAGGNLLGNRGWKDATTVL